MTDSVEGESIIFIPEMLLGQCGKEQDFVLRSTAMKEADTLGAKNEGNGEEDDPPKSDEHLHEKQTAALHTEVKEQAPFDEIASSGLMRNDSILVDSREKKLELQLFSD